MADCQGYEEGVTSFNEHPHKHKSALDKIKYLGCERINQLSTIKLPNNDCSTMTPEQEKEFLAILDKCYDEKRKKLSESLEKKLKAINRDKEIKKKKENQKFNKARKKCAKKSANAKNEFSAEVIFSSCMSDFFPSH